MLADLMMQLYLSLLEGPLPGFKANFVQCLYGILNPCAHVESPVDNSVGTDTKNFGQLNAAGKDLAQAILRSASTTRPGRRRRSGNHVRDEVVKC